MEQNMSKHNLYTSNSEKTFLKENIKFFLKLFLFACMVIYYLYHIMPQYEGSYTAALLDKVERLESIEEPKVVLLGHSNLAFGICSDLIESEIGMPVVNMGLHGGLGNVFHERMAEYNVTEGDIYILCASDFADDGSLSDTTLAWVTLENHPKLWKLVHLSELYSMLEGYPAYLKKSIALYNSNYGNIDPRERDPNDLYARSAFNKYGDIFLERKGSEYTFTFTISPPSINDITVNRINELAAWLEKQGATLLIAAYPIGQGELTVPKEEFEEFQKELENRLNCDVISQYTDYMYDYSYFYDTHMHLNSAGAAMRTRQLIEDIKRWQEQEPYY